MCRETLKAYRQKIYMQDVQIKQHMHDKNHLRKQLEELMDTARIAAENINLTKKIDKLRIRNSQLTACNVKLKAKIDESWGL